jgi:hypothetical protein
MELGLFPKPLYLRLGNLRQRSQKILDKGVRQRQLKLYGCVQVLQPIREMVGQIAVQRMAEFHNIFPYFGRLAHKVLENLVIAPRVDFPFQIGQLFRLGMTQTNRIANGFCTLAH